MQKIRQFLLRPYLYVFFALIGISFKIYQLDRKIFWFDEVCTIQHTSGIPDKDYPLLIPENEIKNIEFYVDLYHLNKQDYSAGSELKGLLKATQLNPLYYPFLMAWYRIVGDDPADYRLFNVIIFIITLPFLFLLSRKLFGSITAGWIAVSLFAVSPFIHLFSQEARYYIFWTFVLIVMNWLFLQAISINSNNWWIAYILLAAMSLYASPVSVIIISGHILYVLLIRKHLLKKLILSMIVVFVLYLPWALHLYFKFNEIASGLSWQANNENNTAFWLPLMGQVFYLISIFSSKLDFFSAFSKKSFEMPPEALSAFMFNAFVFALLIVAFVFLFNKTKKEIRNFLLLIIVPGLTFFYFNDVIRNGMTSWWWRYLIFIAPGIILVMTNLLYNKIEKGSFLYSGFLLALFFIGINSLITISGARHWNIGYQLNEFIEDAGVISECRESLLITDFDNNKKMSQFMVVMLECKNENIDILKVSADDDQIEDSIGNKKYSDIYVFYASDELTGKLKTRFGDKMEKLNREGISTIWKIEVENVE